MLDWSQLHEEILELIFNKLHLMSDTVRCGAACKSWHSFWRDWGGSARCQLPLLMISSEDNPNSSDQRNFLSCSNESRMYTIYFPGNGGKRCCGSSNNGWWVTVDLNQDIQIFHPWRRIIFHLPHQSTFRRHSFITFDDSPKNLRDKVITKAFVSPDESTVVAIYDYCFMGFCKIGDGRWTNFVQRRSPSEGCVEDVVDDGEAYFLNGRQICHNMMEDVVYHKGKIYAVDCAGCIWLCHIDTHIPNVEQLTHNKVLYRPYTFTYLVVDSWTDQMFAVGRDVETMDDDAAPHKTLGFDVFEVCLECDNYLPIESLGDRIMFIGHNSSILVRASDIPGCKPNCIYFTDDYSEPYLNPPVIHQFRCNNLGIFDMEEGTVQPLLLNRFHPTMSPLIWVTPPVKRNPQVIHLDQNHESKQS